jgi:hypothetical protein
MLQMCRGATFLVVLAVLIGGFFSGGCSLKGVAAEAAEGGYEKLKELIKNEVSGALPGLEAKLEAIAEKKLAEQEAKGFAIFDAELAKVAPPDPVTGGKTAKTWKDFDVDKNGHLEPLEVGRISAYVLLEGKKRFDEGAITKEEWSETQKNTAKGGGILGAVAIGAFALKKRKEARDKAAKASASAGPDPKPPAPATVPASTG